MLLCIVKFTHIKRRTAVLMVIVCTGMVVISGIFPTENLFIKFRSPYDVFHYVMSGDVKGLLNGKNSCAVIYSDGKYDGGNLIIPKVEDGYQIPNYFMSKRVSHRFDRNGTFDIYQVSETEECNGVQREHNKKLNNGLPILHKVPPKRDYGRYFCIMAEKGGTSLGGLTEKLSPFFHAKKQEVNAYGR